MTNMELDDVVLGYARVESKERYLEELDKFGEMVDIWDSKGIPNKFPCITVFIKSTYCGITSLTTYYKDDN